MQFWSGTAFMTSADALAVASMLDESGYDGYRPSIERFAQTVIEKFR